MKTAELTGALLDYWVARASSQFSDVTFERREDCIACLADVDGEKFVAAFIHGGNVLATMRLKRKYQHAICFGPSTDWAQGGPIIEGEKFDLTEGSGLWCAYDGARGLAYGLTPLIAAMRAYVTSKFGDEVPDEPAAAHQASAPTQPSGESK